MMKINFVVLLSIFVLAISFNSFCKNDRDLPNIVLIFTDDAGYGDVGSYGATGLQTPNIDKMASQGMRFTNFYAAQPVCTASRAGLLTGCYPNRMCIPGVLFPDALVNGI